MQTLLESACIRDQWIIEASVNPEHYEVHDNIVWFSLYRTSLHPQYTESAIIEIGSDKTYGFVGYEINKSQFKQLKIAGVTVI
jgi:hypothetical protein